MSKEVEELREKVEIEKEKIKQADEIKKLNTELLRLQNQKAAKVADVVKDIPRIMLNATKSLIQVVGGIGNALNKMDERVVEMQKKEAKEKGKKEDDGDLNGLIMNS